MKKLYLTVGSLVAICVLVGTYMQRHALACEILPFSGMDQLQPNVYTTAEFSSEQVAALSEYVTVAVERIHTSYGATVANPRLLITGSVAMANKWGANETASMHRMPWRTCIVIGPQGQNVDVIAHEWLHAEIQTRAGLWNFLNQIPVWFDEGVALTVDFRAPFLPENIQLSEDEIMVVRELSSARDFFSGDNMRHHYQAARLTVDPLIQPSSFFAQLDRIGQGEHFDTVFLNVDSLTR